MNDVLDIEAGHTIRLRARHDYEPDPAPRIYIADAIAENRSTTLGEYQRQEKALGDRRFAVQGEDPDVDTLYDQLNAEIMRVKTLIAQEVIASLHLTIDGDVDAAIDGAFFSRNAGCDTCPCSPGVVAGVKLLWNGGTFDVWVEAP